MSDALVPAGGLKGWVIIMMGLLLNKSRHSGPELDLLEFFCLRIIDLLRGFTTAREQFKANRTVTSYNYQIPKQKKYVCLFGR